MKRFTLLLLFVTSLFISTSVYAQSFDDTYQKFLSLYDTYRANYTQYINAKSQFLQYGTLSSRSEALSASKSFLTSRSDVLLQYLQLLKFSNKADIYVASLDDHLNFISTEKGKIPALATLDDVERYSRRIEDRHEKIQQLSRQIVGTIITDKLDHIKLRLLLHENDAAGLIAQLRSQNKDVATLERWLTDEKAKRVLGEEKIAEARVQIDKISDSNVSRITQEFTDIQQTLSQSQQYFKEALSYMHELSEAIKYGNY